MSQERITKTPFAVILLVCLQAAAGHTQVVRDGSIGPGASVQPVGPVFEITEAMGESAGSNLFHSFSQFTFGAQESVVFRANSAIANIFARVTGGAPSVIAGRLAAPGNLFLINPFGFMFERSARVDVPGAFHVTTADFIDFETGETFLASPVAGSVLSVAKPEYFGFLNANPKAPIEVRSDLGSSGHPVSLIGGPSAFVGDRVVAVRDDGFSDVTIDRGTENLRLDRVFIRGGKISLSGGDVDVRRSALLNATVDADAGGIELIDGKERQVAVDIRAAGRVSIDGTFIGSDTSGEGRGGDIRIQSGTGQDLVVSGDSAMVTSTRWQGTKAKVVSGGVLGFVDPTDFRGDGGDISLVAGRDLVLASSALVTQNLGNDSAGGGIQLSAARDVRAQDGSVIESLPMFSFTGPVLIEAGRDVRLSDSFVKSDAGPDIFQKRERPEAILVRAAETILLEGTTISTASEPDGLAGTSVPGPITLEGKVIDLRAGTSIDASDAGVLDTGGTITLNATERVDISRSSVESSGRGKPGQVQIAAPRVSVVDESRIESLNIAGNDPGRVSIRGSDQLVVADSSIRADGGLFPGRVSLVGGDISLTRSNVTSVVAISDPAGEPSGFGIDISARNLRIEGGAITARSDGAAPAGDITMSIAESLNATDHAAITTTSRGGAGGDITLAVGEFLQAIDSEISTSVLGGAGGGGNIKITMGGGSDVAVMILERSQLTARAVEGRGGNMTIVTGLFVPSGEPETVVSASSVLGIAGEVQIDAPGTLTTLPAVFLDAAGLIRQSCAAQRSESSASLFLRDRGGMPASPGGLLPAAEATRSAPAARAPDYAGALVGVMADGRPVLLTVRCEK